MNVELIKFIVKDLPNDEQIAAFWYDKAQANDHASDHNEEPLTESEWLFIWHGIQRDKLLNQMADELFDKLFWHVINKRKGLK